LEEPAQQDSDSEQISAEGDLASLTLQDLQKLLEEAVKDEDFDAAMELQQEIKKRNKKIE
ncbi:MAG TPA: hypothetical protein DCL65_07670, partial [Chryseobacterium sp.]|nr:hypothetical protein [Chryseobacterium sp.]